MCSNYIGAQFLETFYRIRRRHNFIRLSICSSVLVNLVVNVGMLTGTTRKDSNGTMIHV